MKVTESYNSLAEAMHNLFQQRLHAVSPEAIGCLNFISGKRDWFSLLGNPSMSQKVAEYSAAYSEEIGDDLTDYLGWLLSSSLLIAGLTLEDLRQIGAYVISTRLGIQGRLLDGGSFFLHSAECVSQPSLSGYFGNGGSVPGELRIAIERFEKSFLENPWIMTLIILEDFVDDKAARLPRN